MNYARPVQVNRKYGVYTYVGPCGGILETSDDLWQCHGFIPNRGRRGAHINMSKSLSQQTIKDINCQLCVIEVAEHLFNQEMLFYREGTIDG
jgi:hypothetical protein